MKKTHWTSATPLKMTSVSRIAARLVWPPSLRRIRKHAEREQRVSAEVEGVGDRRRRRSRLSDTS